MYPEIGKIQKLLLQLKPHMKGLSILMVSIGLPAVYILVYKTGGVTYVYSHTMYIVILLAGFTLGIKWGTITGILAGILLGPLMPLDTVKNIPQEFFNWFFRLLMFTIIGSISGAGADTFRKNIQTITTLFSHNIETGIPNKNILSMAKAHAQEPDKKQIALTVLVNNYDNLMNILGHQYYYKVLKTVYQNLKSNVGENTMIMQASGNKLWLCKPCNNAEDEIKEIFRFLQIPMTVEDIPIYVEFSIGAALIDNLNSLTIETYRNCDAAARYAQNNNIAYSIYDERHKINRYDFNLLGVFLKALEEDQTFLVYQPKINLKTGKPAGLEALIRWEHPSRGLIMPNVFIPLVEETQLINHLTDWVLKKVIYKIKEFKAAGIDIHISMNISAKNLFDINFFQRVTEIVKEEGVSPSQIEFEIVESVLMTNPENCKRVLSNLGEQGFLISIDDFGKGYSSLAYLSEYPIDIVKLDQYFMRRIALDTAVQHTVKTTIDLAHQLGFQVVSEGIEEENVAKIAAAYQSDLAQGYYFSRPIKGNEIIPWYKKALGL